ncbi:CG0192-related protein [Aeromicrobium ginsengisoli]|uniref:Maltokinase N-terminal cap domain-containing protein n=1 Tax=Aeromicrobium ginsengisoli TaxID=363867 RepID=A0A5M4FBC2_9ACTN|nr:hypothetical protein [Aeromicrobium ginsengisoli]KAA1395696.1 hypothetical protein ESP70_016255 [Aeromicrobium ginsengisoli]
MAILHATADITPTKPELLATWLPTQPWFAGDATVLQHLGAYRFDDPDGEVGIETHLVRAGDGPVLQVPWTYRGAPLDGAESFLVGTMEHTVLGLRWIYDAIGDPVYQAVLAATILTGGTQAELVREFADGRTEIAEPSVRVKGSGGGSDVPPVDLEVVRLPGGPTPEGDEVLTGTWAGADEPIVLAVARLR